MLKEQKRDNAYYERLLKRRFPTIHADYRSGKFKSLREALIVSGIKPARTRLHELKNAWLKATVKEQREFARWLRAQIGGVAIPPGTSIGSIAGPIAVDRRLEMWVASRIEIIMTKRGLTMGDVMHELGFPRLNASLGMAIHRGTKLQPAVLTALDKWLTDNKGI